MSHDREELLQYERHFSSMLTNISLGCVMLDWNWNIFFVNEYMLGITGWKREEVLSKKFVDMFVPPQCREKVLNTQLLVSEGFVEASCKEDRELMLKNGDTITFEWNNSVIKNAAGKFLGLSYLGKPKGFPITQLYLETKTRDTFEYRSDENLLSIGDYLLLKALGGENGHVQLAVHKTTNQKVAVKSLKKDQMSEEELERARREIKIMEQLTLLNNPYIIKLIEWHETNTHFNLIVEYVSGGELVSLIKEKKGITESLARKLFKQMLCALTCCHKQNIIHRDLKLQNILLDSAGNIKLIDFGLSNFFEIGVFRNTFCGTPAFAPPEILLGKEYKGPEVDLWSLGVVLYSMITAEFPFKTVGEILKGKFEEPTNVSEDCLDLLKKLLVVKKEDRLDVEGVSAHPWIRRASFGEAVYVGSSGNIVEPDLKKRRSY